MNALYRPHGPRGQTGPTFDYLTIALIWCLGRPDFKQWDVEPIAPQKAIVGQDGMTLCPAPDSDEGKELIAFYDRPNFRVQ
jgi:hypothetical protein